MAKRKSTHKATDRVTQTPLDTQVNSGVPEGLAVPSPLVASVVLIQLQTKHLNFLSSFSAFHVPPPCGTYRECSNMADGSYANTEHMCTSFYTCQGGIFLGHTPCSPGNMFVCLFAGVQRHLQQYFSYIVAVSFIGGENRRIRRKPPTCHKPLTNLIT